MKSLLSLFLCTFLFFSFSSEIQAKKMKGPLSQLDLSKEQRKKIREFRKNNKGSKKKIKKEIRGLKKDFREAFIEGESDGKLRSLQAEIKSLRDKKMEFKINRMIFLKNTLNQEQREKFIEIRKKHKKHKKHSKHKKHKKHKEDDKDNDKEDEEDDD